MKEITLTNGGVTIVDDADYLRLIAMGSWYLSNCGYAMHGTTENKKSKKVLLHRALFGDVGKMDIDHINANKLDNRRENLRVCSRSQNMMNVGKRSNNTSGYKGVSWCKRKKKWQVVIWKDCKAKAVGKFKDKLTAAMHFNIAAIAMHGEFAFLNKIEVTSG